jgi:REP element-mobilizing transposase RayT
MKNEGKIVEKNLKEIEQHFKTIQIHEYIIMPNHIHFILANNPVGAGLDLPAETKTKEKNIANNPVGAGLDLPAETKTKEKNIANDPVGAGLDLPAQQL